jgi:hypothetical protein
METNENKTGFSRPGALQMLASAALMLVGAIGPFFVASSRPSHEWFMVVTGAPAFAMSLIGVAVLVLYLIGFFRYCASKGYSKWLGLFLFFANLPGFIVLLLLPDLHSRTAQEPSNTERPLETSAYRGKE